MFGLMMLSQAKTKMKKIREEKGGASSIEIVMGIMIFIVVLCAMLDLLILSWKFAVISQTTSSVARIASIQGGSQSSAPDGFPGGQGAYINSSALKSRVDKAFENGNIAADEYTLTINGTELGGNVKVDYREMLNVRTEVRYRWRYLSGIIPGRMESGIASSRVGMSEFKYRYDEWKGE